MTWAEEAVLKRLHSLTTEDIRRIEIAAERYEESLRPDGAHEYISLTEGYSLKDLIGRRTLRSLAE